MSSTSTAGARVLVVEDHALMREGIDRRLTAAGFTVAGMVGSIADAEAEFDRLHPDLVLTDHFLADGTGVTLLRRLLDRHPGAQVLLLSASDDKALITTYLNEGASGFMHKSVDVDEFVHCVRAALAGNRALDTVATARVLESLNDPAPAGTASPLSKREVEVLSLVADGCTNDDIAGRLYISPQTVKTHMTRIFGKLGVRDRASAAVRATREGILG